MVEKTSNIGGLRPLPLDKIHIDEWNVRTLDKDKGIEELEDSILKYGLLQPIVVFEERDKFHLIIGQRRVRAFKELKKKGHSQFSEIPSVILSKKPDEESAKILSLSENIHRVELNRADIVEVISFLYKRYNKSANRVAKILGKSISYVYDHLKIQDAPNEIKQMLAKREIRKEDVKRVMEIAANDKDKMIRLAKEMKGLTAPEKVRLVEVARQKPQAKPDEWIDDAKKPRIEEKMIVPLTLALITALDRAVKDIGLSREEIAKKALEDWLGNKGYYHGQ
jgi:ParB family chromosome partitioning protein